MTLLGFALGCILGFCLGVVEREEREKDTLNKRLCKLIPELFPAFERQKEAALRDLFSALQRERERGREREREILKESDERVRWVMRGDGDTAACDQCSLICAATDVTYRDGMSVCEVCAARHRREDMLLEHERRKQEERERDRLHEALTRAWVVQSGEVAREPASRRSSIDFSRLVNQSSEVEMEVQSREVEMKPQAGEVAVRARKRFFHYHQLYRHGNKKLQDFIKRDLGRRITRLSLKLEDAAEQREASMWMRDLCALYCRQEIERDYQSSNADGIYYEEERRCEEGGVWCDYVDYKAWIWLSDVHGGKIHKGAFLCKFKKPCRLRPCSEIA